MSLLSKLGQGIKIEIFNSLSLETVVVLVTPELAEYWLHENNWESNRNIIRSRVEKYTEIIEKGEWQLGDSLKFDKDGILIDGQHRLHAVVTSKKPTQFVVTIGYERNSAEVFDRGAFRSLSDICTIAGNSWVTATHVSIFNNLFHTIEGSNHKLTQLTDHQKIKGINNVKEGLELSLFGHSASAIKSSSARAVICRAYYHGIDKNLLKDFLLLLHGKNYFDHAPEFSQTYLSPTIVVKLREKFLSNNYLNWEAKEGGTLVGLKYRFTQSTLHSYINNRNISYARAVTKNLFPVKWLDDFTFDK